MARILVIDDDAFMQELTQFALEVEGHSVTVAADGQQALARLDSEPFDLMLVDLYMPVMDGIRFLTEVRNRLTDPPRAIVLSGSTDTALRQQVCELGAYDLIRKPVGTSELKARLDEALKAPRAGPNGG